MRERIQKKIKFFNVFNNGCDYFSFVHCEHTGSHRIAYAFIEKDGENHTQIYEQAVEENFFNDEIEPSGGGVFDAKSEEYLRGSIHYGQTDDEIVDIVGNKLHHLKHC